MTWLGWTLLSDAGSSLDAPPDVPAGTAGAPAASAAPAGPAPAGAAQTPVPTAARTAVDRALPSPAAAAGPPRVVGRCLAPDGAPLAGCSLILRVLRPTPELAPHAGVTGGDGRFALVVPRSVGLELLVRARGRASRMAPIGAIEPGVEVDLGDVVLRRGRRVVGTLRDEQGMPLAHALVRMQRAPVVRELQQRTRPLRVVEVRSDAAGGFAFPDALQPGHWVVGAASGTTKPSRFELLEQGDDCMLDLVVARAAEVPTIAGAVWDEASTPVPRATVRALGEAGADGKLRVVATAITDAEGSFLLASRAGAQPVQLQVEAAGCEFPVDERRHEWNTHIDLRVVRSAAIAVRVTTRAGRPVEDFALHVFGPQTSDLRELRARSRGYHADGVAHAHGVRPGAQVVVVEPTGSHLVADGVLRLQHAGFATRLDLVVDPAVRRRIRVVASDGTPVPLASVELLLPLGDRPLTRDTPAAKLLDLWRCRGERALRVVSALSDGAGLVELVGHPDTRYGLRIKSLRHACYFAEVVLGTLAGLTEVRAPAGARIEGSLMPAEFVREVRQVTRGFGRAKAPQLALVATVDGHAVRHEVDLGPDDDGHFVFDHVAPGDWQLEASWTDPGGAVQYRVDAARGHRRAAGKGEVALEDSVPAPVPPAAEPRWSSVEVHDRRYSLLEVAATSEGETRHLAVPVAHLRYATLRGRIAADRGWLRQARLVALEPKQPNAVLLLDDAGAFWIRARPGTYRCEVAGAAGTSWLAAGAITLQPGQAGEATFVVERVHARFRVTDATGAPAAGIRLRLVRAEGDRHEVTLTETDAGGEVAADATAGRHVVYLAEQKVAEVDVRLDRVEPIPVRLPPAGK